MIWKMQIPDSENILYKSGMLKILPYQKDIGAEIFVIAGILFA